MASFGSHGVTVPAQGAPIEPSVRTLASPSTRVGKLRAAARRLRLSGLVHWDAFRFDAFGYVQALFWRSRGLKVRSRNRLAALMGRSPHAYALWIARIEPQVRAELLGRGTSPDPLVIPVVNCLRRTGASLRESLASIAAAQTHVTPIVVGPENPSGTLAVSAPEDLSRLVNHLGSWLCIIHAGDLLATDGLDIYSHRAADAGTASVIYADDDLLAHGNRHSPHFKSSWNPELFEHHDFISGSAIVRVTPEMFLGLDQENWVEQLTKRAIARGPAPVHLPAVLHHREKRPIPVRPSKPARLIAEEAPAVTIIVPTRNQLSYLQTCIDGVRRTAYPNFDLMVVDNESDDREALDYLAALSAEDATVLRVSGAFNFSALNNAAVRHARGEFVCFLNNDVELIDPDWLALLVRQAVRSDVGAVGSRLLYPDGTVQHAGVVTGVGGGAAHAHRNLSDDDSGYFLRDRLPQRVTAVTAACMVVSKAKFLAVGGFDETDFPVAFNDVDLCLKLNGRGWQSFYEPRSVLIHHESKSRGNDSTRGNRARFAGELAALKQHWGTDLQRDPFHHPHLSPFCEQFLIAI
jgi:O-antigen biosynthesis protein